MEIIAWIIENAPELPLMGSRYLGRGYLCGRGATGVWKAVKVLKRIMRAGNKFGIETNEMVVN